MADKQATVYIVDQGASMAECHSGRVESDFDFAMQYVWDKICTTMAANRTTWSLGVVGLRTEETVNELCQGDDPDGSYDNIAVHKELGPATMDDLTRLQSQLKTSANEAGDALSAVVVAIDMIDRYTTLKTGKPGKFTRKIVLVTDGQGVIDGDDVDPIYQKLNDSGIELVVLGVDFDDLDFGFKEEDKSEHKRNNEALLQKLVDGCSKGIFGTVAEAVENLSIPELKPTKPYANYKGRLSLGDYEEYPETALYIDVQRYFFTKVARPLTASSFVEIVSSGNSQPTAQSSYTLDGDTEMGEAPELSAVRSNIRYQVNDASEVGGKRDIDREDLEKGFEYGRTAVSISKSDENVTKLETVTSFSIIGFVHSDTYERYLNMGESCITVATPTNEKAVLAFSSLVQALEELTSCAVARIVTKEGKDPSIILLAPMLENHVHALVDVPLPFAEDVRMYRFPPLDRVVTASGATVTKHRNLPNDDLLKSMSDYVDAMDLSTFGKDDEGQPTEYMKVDETYSPAIHRINKAIRDRASNPKAPVAKPADVLMQWSKPPAELVSKTSSELQKLTESAKTKKVPAKKKGKRFTRETKAPLSGLDVDDLLNRETPQEITKENAIPAFKQRLRLTKSDKEIGVAVKKMDAVICDIIKESTLENGYARALENVRVVREEMVLLEQWEIYNDFIKELKMKILGEKLGVNRRSFFLSIKTAKLGLIDERLVDHSPVTEEEATKFYSMKMDIPVRGK
ncbi:hypothetical protein HYFRA_00005729 [Hymenoscyphus fraxineus]|uniref:ATP-dependent DNA helicase II subunit 2 n=1 Tax=Hymenoscyphus fraxineus TaxID=746836 RepID=A0A9N9KR20_9HELO|nr:hypothetical protein HYFRA_00005729 [Hymenoscyphus fraxineus]